MTDLSETFGEDFAEQYESERKRRQQEREKVGDETLAKIAQKAVNTDQFSGDNPKFQFKSESGITHDVLLMTLPDLDDGNIFTYTNDLDSGAVTCPLDYMGEWMSCLFNDKDMLTRMEPGSQYLVVGNLSQWEADDGEMRDQMSPVRGVVSIEEIKKYVSDGIQQEVNEEEEDEEEPDMEGINENPPEMDETSAFSTNMDEEVEEEDEEDDTDEEEEDNTPSFSLGDDNEEEDEEEEDDEIVNESDVHVIVEELADYKEEVKEIEGPEDERIVDVAKYVIAELDYPKEEGVPKKVRDAALDRIYEYQEDDDEEEEFDMGDEENIFS